MSVPEMKVSTSPSSSSSTVQSVIQTDKGEIDQEKNSSYNPNLQPPDGGFGWMVAFAAMLCSFTTWGVNGSFGVFLDYYMTQDTFPGGNKVDYAFVGGIVVCLAMLLGPSSAFLVHLFGTRTVVLTGIFLQTAAYLLASFSTKLWQIFLTQGVLVGVSFGMVFMPSVMSVPSWFTTKTGAAMGLANTGSGLGGLVYSLAVSAIVEGPGGHQWALRMVCFTTLFVSVIAAVFLKPFNAPPKPPFKDTMTRHHLSEAFRATCDMTIFYRHIHLAFLASWFCVILIGYVLVLFLVASYATSIGLSSTKASNLTSIINAAQVVGRPLMGILADKCGRYNATICFTAFGTLVIFALWMTSTNYGILIAFCATFGLVCGVSVTLGMTLARDGLGPKYAHHLRSAWGGLLIMSSPFALTSSVIGLELTQDSAAKPYKHCQIFAGVAFAYGILALFPVREAVVRRTLHEQIESITSRREELINSDGEARYDEIKDISNENSSQAELLELQAEQEKIEVLLQRTALQYAKRCVLPRKV